MNSDFRKYLIAILERAQGQPLFTPRALVAALLTELRADETVHGPSGVLTDEARDALEGWLAFAEEELSEFDVEECDSEKLCHKCESAGCINLKIRNTRAALSVVPEKAEGWETDADLPTANDVRGILAPSLPSANRGRE